MIRAAITHAKVQGLMRALDVPQYAAIGLLESIWHLTAERTPNGNIGQLSNAQIAAWIEWTGDPETLVAALIEIGFLDPDPESRLVFHDWKHHPPLPPSQPPPTRAPLTASQWLNWKPCDAAARLSKPKTPATPEESWLALLDQESTVM